MKITKETMIEVDAAKVWNILGPRYPEAYKWASSVNHSMGQGTAEIEGAPCSRRVCETEIGRVQEKVETYNEQTYEISYSAKAEKMPFFVKSLLNTWKVVPDGPMRSKVLMRLEVGLMFPFNIIMALPMRLQLSSLLQSANEELKYFAENNEQPHPRKLKADNKYQTTLDDHQKNSARA